MVYTQDEEIPAPGSYDVSQDINKVRLVKQLTTDNIS